MLKTIILLTKTAEQQPPLGALLREHNPGLAFCSALSARDLLAIDPAILGEARLVSFANDIAVPAKVLFQLGYGAYQFYVTPVQHPDLLTVLDDSDDPRSFSAIAQSMTIWPDSCRVIGLKTVTVPEGAPPIERDRLTVTPLARLFWQLSAMVANEEVERPGIIDVSDTRLSIAQMN